MSIVGTVLSGLNREVVPATPVTLQVPDLSGN